MGTQYGFSRGMRLFGTTTLVSVFALMGCTQVDERMYPKGHYDNYYGQPPAKRAYHKAPKKIELQTNAPRKYVVKKGDTLWSISKRFLIKPWYWPEIWDKNQRIQNPHLIYPGDTLYLTFVKGNNGKLEPRIRVDRGKGQQPVSSLIPFLAWPNVLDKSTVEHAPYIVASQDNYHLITEGHRVYVKNLKAQEGDRFAVFHKKKELIDPETNRHLGFEVDYTGYARVDRPNSPLSTAHVISAEREIRPGDKLFRPEDETRGLHVPIQDPDKRVRGTVMSLFDADAISGQYMIAVINRGKRQGMKVGYTLGVYSDGKTVIDPVEKERATEALTHYQKDKLKNLFNQKKVKPLPKFDVQVELPPERVATMVIYKVTDNVSFGLITESERAVRVGDKIGNP